MSVRTALLTLLLFCTGLARAEESPLKILYDRSDLIIDATFLEDVSAGLSTSEIFEGKPLLNYLETAIHVKVNKVLKGQVAQDKPLLIGATVMSSLGSRPNPATPGATFSFSGKDPEPWLRKNDRYIIFLEDRRKREPNSTATSSGEHINFRTFDYWLWRIPANDAIDLQFAKWKKD